MYTESLEQLITHFSKLPGIGKKTAQRLAFFVLKSSADFTTNFAEALKAVKEQTRFCSECFNIAEDTLCPICQNSKREQKTLMVVAEFSDIFAIEKTNEYNGLYHVLGGVLSPLDGIGPDSLHISPLIERIETKNISELILALTPNTEGEATSSFLLGQLAPFNLNISRIARGVPIGTQLDYIDQVTLGRAISGRSHIG